MDEQNIKPKRKQNVIRFPSSKWERRRILRESKDVRVRAIVMLRLVCGWLLIAAVFLFLVSNYRIFTPSSIRSMASYALAGLREREGDITTINYENGTIADGALFENGLAYADSDSLFLEKPGDMLTMRHTIGFTSPVVETCGDYVLVYDRGGTQATLANSLTAAAELTLDSTIITGSIGRDGHFVLVSDEQGYRTAATVYDTSGEAVFKFQSSEYYIVSAVLSPDCKTVAVLGFKQNGVATDSHLLLFSVSSGERLSDAVLSDALGLNVCFLSNSTAAVLTDEGLFRTDRKGNAEPALEIAASDLLAYAMQEGEVALVTRSYSSGSRSDLYTIRSDGKLFGPIALTEEPSAAAISNAGVALLTTTGVSVYDTYGTPLWRNSDAVGARRVLLTDDGTLFALYTKNTRVFTARSSQSEEIKETPYAAQ